MAGSLWLKRLVLGLMAAAVTGIALAAALPEKLYTLTIAGNALPAEQRLIKVTKDDRVRLLVTSDAPGNLHLHGYRVDIKLVPGKRAEFVFRAYATGRYPFEWHGADETVKAAKHHGPEFAVLEVHPK